MFDESDSATWYDTPAGYRWETVDHVTGEMQLFAPDGRNVSGGPAIGEIIPEPVINAAIVAAMREHEHDPYYAERLKCYQYCDMRPVVHRAERIDPVNQWGDSWVVEVQYSSKGGRAIYGVNRDHVPSCYMD